MKDLKIVHGPFWVDQGRQYLVCPIPFVCNHFSVCLLSR